MFQQTVKWWFVLVVIYITLNFLNSPKDISIGDYVINFYSIKSLFFVIIFCLLLSFVYSLIKLISIKNIIKENKYEIDADNK
ncbi:MAG: hypothetical protein IJK61_03015 [Bacteroidetes bacterium]|nr:hypothetical protein [Bacteroidota bacterium]